MNARCIAYREDGRLCGAPATVLDLQRGGMVCAAHSPAPEPEPDPESRRGTWSKYLLDATGALPDGLDSTGESSTDV